jgi:hypothetical protein
MTAERHAKTFAMLLALLLGSEAAIALAMPTPVPGGANQINGVQGTFAQVLFNGTLRLRSMSLSDPRPGEAMRPSAASDRALVFRAIVSNGTQRENHGFFNATLADANGITITGRPLDDGWGLEPGTAAKTAIGFSVPADFVPTKLVLIQAAAPKPRAFRITVRPTDIPAAPAQ